VNLDRGYIVAVKSEIKAPISTGMSVQDTQSDTRLVRGDHRHEIDVGGLETGVLDPDWERGTGTESQSIFLTVRYRDLLMLGYAGEIE
jgi:hypothetical protein